MMLDGDQQWSGCRSGDEKSLDIRSGKHILGTGRKPTTWTRNTIGAFADPAPTT